MLIFTFSGHLIFWWVPGFHFCYISDEKILTFWFLYFVVFALICFVARLAKYSHLGVSDFNMLILARTRDENEPSMGGPNPSARQAGRQTGKPPASQSAAQPASLAASQPAQPASQPVSLPSSQQARQAGSQPAWPRFQRSVFGMQHPALRIQHPASRIQCPASSV